MAVLEFGTVTPARYPGTLRAIGGLFPDGRLEAGFDIVLHNGVQIGYLRELNDSELAEFRRELPPPNSGRRVEDKDILMIEQIPPGRHSGQLRVTGRATPEGSHELGVDLVREDGVQLSFRVELGGESAGPLARDLASIARSVAHWGEGDPDNQVQGEEPR